MADKKPTYWEKEEKSRPKMDWKNAGFSKAELAAKKLAAAKVAAAKAANTKKKFQIPASPTK